MGTTRPPTGPGRLDLWDLSSVPASPRILSSRIFNTSALPVSDDGSIVALEQPGREVFLHDVVRNKQVGQTLAIGQVYKWIFPSNDGRMLVVVIDSRTAALWDCLTGREKARYQLPEGGPRLIWFSPDSRYLAFDFWNGNLEVRDLITGVVHSVPPNIFDPSSVFAFSPDSRLIARSVSQVGSIQPTTVWQLDPWRLVATYPGTLAFSGTILFTPDNRSMILGIGRTATRWNFSPLPEQRQPGGHADEAWSLAFSPDGSVVASGSDDTDEPHTIKLWDARTGQLVRGWHAGNGTVRSGV